MALRLDLPGTCLRVIFVPADEKPEEHLGHNYERDTITFFDRDYDFTPDGQHTGSSYFVESILGHKEQVSRGLDLMRSVDKWKVDEPSMRLCINWLERCVETQNKENPNG